MASDEGICAAACQAHTELARCVYALPWVHLQPKLLHHRQHALPSRHEGAWMGARRLTASASQHGDL